MEVLPIRIKTARIVFYGYVTISGAGMLLHFLLAWINNLSVIWIYQGLMFVIMIAGLLALRQLDHSLSQAMWLNTWIDTICVGGMVIYVLEEATTQTLAIAYMFHVAILALSLILGFKAATRYATVITLFLLCIGIYYDKLGEILGFIFLAYGLALPAKLIELMIEESKAQLREINEELRAHRDHLDQLVRERTADLVEANAQLQQEIAERKQVESKLRTSESELRAIFTAMRDVVIMFDREGHYVKIAPASPQLLYKPADELLGKTVHEIFEAEVADRFLKAIHLSLNSADAVSIEYPLEIRGEQLWFDALVSPAAEDTVVLVARDITWRKRIEEELRTSRAQLAIIADGLPALITHISANLQYLYVNQHYANWYGYRKEELPGKRVADVLAEDVYRNLAKHYETVLAGREVSFESDVRDKEGKPRIMRTNLVPQFDEKGAVSAFFAMTQDITDRKRAEQELQESEARFRAIFEWAPIGISLANKEGQYIRTNPALQELLGYSASELREMGFIDITHANDATTKTELYHKMMAGEREHFRLETRYVRKNGNVVWVDLSVSLVRDAAGEPLFTFGMVEDITERKRAIDQMEHRVAFETIITLISTEFINLKPEEIDTGIHNALQTVGRFASFDRGYIVQFSDSGEEMNVTYEWCAEGVEGISHNLQNISVDTWPEWFETLDNTQGLYIPHSDVLSPTASAEREFLEKYDINSLVAVPLLYQGKLGGVLAFTATREDVIWEEEDIALLHVLGQTITNALERKAVEIALRESEERYRIISELTSDFAYAFHLKPNVKPDLKWMTAAFTYVTGYTPEEAEQRGWANLIHPDDRAATLKRFQTSFFSQSEMREFRIVTKSGGIRWLQVYSRPERDETNKYIRRLVGAAKDVTERKLAEQALKQRNRELAELNIIISSITSTLALEQVLQRIVTATPKFFSASTNAMIQILGETDDLYTKTASTHATPAKRLKVFRAGERIVEMAIQERCTINVPNLLDDPHYVHESTTPTYRSLLVSPLIFRDQVLGTLSINAMNVGAFSAEDEKMLSLLAGYAAVAVQNAKLFEQTRRDAETKTVLLKEVNHRVKNNLGAIIGLLYAARKHSSVKEQEAQRHIFDDLIGRIQGLAAVHRLLSASEWSPIPLSKVVSQVTQSLLSMTPSDKRILLDVASSPILVDSKQANSLALVINELVTNTTKYAASERAVVHINANATIQDDFVCFEFRDDGPGYPEDVISFERHNVGCYLIKNITEQQLQGDVSLHNDNGAVTTIRFKAADDSATKAKFPARLAN